MAAEVTACAERTESAGAHRGQAPLAATVHELTAALQCMRSGVHAEEPEGVGPEKYNEIASAMIAQLKYRSGLRFHRLERMQEPACDHRSTGRFSKRSTQEKWRKWRKLVNAFRYKHVC